MSLFGRVFLFSFLIMCLNGVYIAQTDSTKSLDSTDVNLPSDSQPDAVDEMVDEMIGKDSSEFKKIAISFIKVKTENSADSTYFNICQIKNNTSEVMSGQLEFRIPEGWNFLGLPYMQITLKPGETQKIPIRLTIPHKAIGGIAYVVDATFTNAEGMYSGEAYIKVPLKSIWDMSVNNSTLYFNEYYENLLFRVNISNKGNAKELIKLDFKIGKLLSILELDKNQVYIEMPEYTDTVLTYTIQRRNLTEEEEYEYKQIWDESVIEIVATAEGAKRVRESIWVRDLENTYYNTRQEKSSPLNVDVRVRNLMSSFRPNLNVAAFGQIQFNGDHDLDYIVNTRNIFYNPNQSFLSNPYNLTYKLNYRWQDKIKASAGLITGYGLHIIRGQGVKGEYNISETDKVKVSYVQSRFYSDWAATGIYEKSLKKGVIASIGGTYEKNDWRYFTATSIDAGVVFSPVKNHFVRINLLGTQSIFDKNKGMGTPSDTTLLGFAYNLNYQGTVAKKLKLGVITRNYQYNYIRTRPSNSIQGFARYTINLKSRLNFIYNQNSVQASKNPYEIYRTGVFNKQTLARLTYYRTINPKFSVEVGPMYKMFNRVKVDTVDSPYINFTNYFVGVFSAARIKLGTHRYLAPSMYAGTTLFKNVLSPSTLEPSMLTTAVGVSYTDKGWGVNTKYIMGPNFFVYGTQIDSNVTYETIYLRGFIEKYYLHRTIKLTGYATYYLQMPMNRQNATISARGDFYLPNRWSANITANMFTNSMDQEFTGVVTHRFFSLNLGVRKSFDIPQPRIKYYDLTVICFNDFNGNGTREENEPLLSNIKMGVKKDRSIPDPKNIRFGEKDLVTDTEGEISIYDIPEGNYKLSFEPLVNLGNLFNANGDDQELVITEDLTLYVPYVESYKVSGRIIMVRDEYSSKGLIKLGGIRVTAVNLDGDEFAALTDNLGNYVINVPQAGYYKVKVNNIFGPDFYIDKEEFIVQFNGFKTFNVDFTFHEGKREVNFNSGDDFDDFADYVDDGGDGVQKEFKKLELDENIMEKAENLKKDIDAISKENEKVITSVDPSKVKFMVEIGLYDENIPVEVANMMMQLGFSPTPIKINGMTIYATDVYSDYTEITGVLKTIQNTGFTQAFIVGSYEGKVITEKLALDFKGR